MFTDAAPPNFKSSLGRGGSTPNYVLVANVRGGIVMGLLTDAVAPAPVAVVVVGRGAPGSEAAQLRAHQAPPVLPVIVVEREFAERAVRVAALRPNCSGNTGRGSSRELFVWINSLMHTPTQAEPFISQKARKKSPHVTYPRNSRRCMFYTHRSSCQNL